MENIQTEAQGLKKLRKFIVEGMYYAVKREKHKWLKSQKDKRDRMGQNQYEKNNVWHFQIWWTMLIYRVKKYISP